MTFTAQDVLYTNQLMHHRRMIHRTGFLRRKWTHDYGWYPEMQKKLFSNTDRVLSETKEKYGADMFRDLAEFKRLNARLYLPPIPNKVDVSYVKKLADIETTNEMYGLFPQYPYEICFKMRGHRWEW